MRDLLGRIDGRVGLPTSVIEAIDDAGRYTVERRLAGKAMLSLLPDLAGAARQTAIGHYVAGAEAVGQMRLPDRDYGQLLGAAPLTDGTWSGYFRRSLDDWLEKNGATIGEAVGDIDGLRRRLSELMKALPDRPEKALVHGDYFPGNVLLDESLNVSGLVDFSVFTLTGDPLYDPITAAFFLEMIDEATAEDVALAKRLVVDRHGAAIVPLARFYRAYAAVLMADPANAGPPYPKLFDWSIANLKALAGGTLDF